MLSVSDLSMRFGGKILFNRAQFQFNAGNHYGLTGANGTGKSTLIKLLTGELTPEKGSIALPSQMTLATLKQNHFQYEDWLIQDVVLAGRPKLWEAVQARKSLLDATGHFSEEDCHRLAQLEREIEIQDGYNAASEASTLLAGLGLRESTHQATLSTLSGGYKLRVLLAQVLFSRPDILLLDEPTNHLDLFSIRWLESYLKNFPGTILLSSHDRQFLNNICDHIVDIDYGTIKIYSGNYDQFEALKQRDRELKEASLEKHEKKREHLQEFIERFRAKSSKARQAQSKMHLVGKLEKEIESLDLTPTSRVYPNLFFEQHRPAGAIPLVVQDLSKSFGNHPVLHKLSFEISRGEKIAIVGANGVGKSTLLDILCSVKLPDNGVIKWGPTVSFAYFPQDHSRLVNPDQTLLEWLQQKHSETSEENLRTILGCLLFTGDTVQNKIATLSGGETARLVLAHMMLQKHNVLVFDEPTNHLDMEATEALIEALQDYEGTIIFVSHNRYFLSRLATHIIEITPEHGLLNFPYRFEEYLTKREVDLLAPTTIKIGKKKEEQNQEYELLKENRRIKAQLTKKVAAAEEKCEKIERKIAALDQLLASEGFYDKENAAKQIEMIKEKKLMEAELAQAYQDWEQASQQLQEQILP